MRSQHFIGILAILVVGFGIKWLFFASPAAEAHQNLYQVPPWMSSKCSGR